MIIREIKIADAESFSWVTQQVEASSDYMLWESGEREPDSEQQLKMIEKFQQQRNSTILVAEHDSRLAGYLIAIGGNANRNRHSVHIVAGILQEYRGKGIGSKLFQGLEKWAFQQGTHRLELTVATRNNAGLSLYQKMGFEIEGTKRNSLFINGEFVDEYYMGKLLNT
ncbi:GNAT family N-acetyltransferase [Virgibacillus ihumii]|uniref:GNAT family N-acetyltransferase n=1 Tax=Virgibacillus ihumii TaxID=2686091 RepID=UPI00157C6325|nr:GNAT family N-acetyltransferase [Virgibacillus ihumii]